MHIMCYFFYDNDYCKYNHSFKFYPTLYLTLNESNLNSYSVSCTTSSMSSNWFNFSQFGSGSSVMISKNVNLLENLLNVLSKHIL